MQKLHSIRRYQPMALAMAVTVAAFGLSACGGSSSKDKAKDPVVETANCTNMNQREVAITGSNGAEVQTSLIEALVDARQGDTFILPEGKFFFDKTIEYNGPADNLTLRGAGMDKTIIDTNGATADGFLFNNTDCLVFEDFGIYESNNNALKITKSDGVIIRRMATVWETDYQQSNGAYGVYPVETSNVLIEESFVKGSADAGIYVGQSDNIIVRNNIAEKNVAGIEIENSTRADVYGNTAEGNTGGILIFDLPIGNGKYGSGVRVFDNKVIANNAPNFANKGEFAGGVHIVPPGTGVIVLSTSDVEIYNNTITDHQTISIAVTSYLLPDDEVAATPKQNVGTSVLKYGDIHPYATMFSDGWSPLVRNINIHDNTISVADGIDAPTGDLVAEIIAGFKGFHSFMPDVATGKATLPHVFYDGIGELLANTPNPDGEGETILQAITGGINQIADFVYQADLESEGFTPIDVSKFSPYAANGGVCQSDNGIDDANLFAASVYETTATAATFGTEGPLTKLEQLSLGDTSLAGAIMSDPEGVMDCTAGFKGKPVTVTFNNKAFGCTSDNKDNKSCAL